MNRNRLIAGLLILSCMMRAGESWADTGTVDAEIVAATKAGPSQVKNLERRAIETIKSDAPMMEKDHACRVLRVIGTVDSVEPLSALLADEKLSHIARYALESMRYPEADRALSDALDTARGRVKVGIINSLAMRADERNVDKMVSLLKDGDGEIAAAAAWALGKIGSSKAISVLAECYRNSDENLRGATADGLLDAAAQLVDKGQLKEAVAVYEQFRGPSVPEHIRAGAFIGLVEAQPDKAMAMLTEAIGSNDRRVRGTAIDMIVTLKGEDITRKFSAGLDKLDADTQALVLGALVARGEKDALRPVITKAVSSPNADIRALAIKSLGDIGDADSVTVLVNVIEIGRDDDDKTLSASSLRRLVGKSINSRIIRAMKKAGPESKATLIGILHDRDATEALDDLLTAASDKDPGVRKAAFRSLVDLAGPENQKDLIELLVKLKGDEGRSEAERALVSVSRDLDKAAATEPIVAAMDSNVAAKCSLLRVLGGVGNTRGFVVVRQALDDSSSEIRDAAVRTLADWPDATAARTLLDIFQTTSDNAHRMLALRGCVRQLSTSDVVSSDMLDICDKLMKSADRPEEKKLVLACLAKSGDPGAAKLVEPLLTGNDVKAEAELAMLGVIRNMMGPMPDQAAATAQTLRRISTNETVKKDAASIVRLVDKFEDYVMAWQVSGPYSKPFADTFDTAFGPEQPDAKGVVWQQLPISRAGNRPWMFNLQAVLRAQRKAGYVRTYVHSDDRQSARIDFGTDDGNKLWLNGDLVHANGEGDAATPGEHKVPVTLQKGWNTLLLKVVQDSGPWQFCLAIRKPNGDKLGGLRISADKPTK